MSLSPYDRDLDRNPANFQPLTPLTFLERSAAVFPDRLAIAHGALRRSYREFHARTKKLASALAKRGFARGDTIAVMLANTPAMLECHYGVPMCGAVLNALNTRLDAASIAFMLDHGEAKALIVDREFSTVIGAALKRAKATAAGHRLRRSRIRRPRRAAGGPRLRGAHRRRRRGLRAHGAGRRMGCDCAQLHLGHDRRSEGRRLPSSRRQPALRRQHPHRRRRPPPGLPLDAADVPLQRLVLSLVRQRQGGRARLPAAGARQADLRPHRRAQGHPHVRRADRHVDPAQRARRREAAAAAHCALLHRRRAPACRRAQGDGRSRLRGDPSLRPDGGLWAGRGQRLEGGVERARRRGSGASQGASGRSLSRARGARRDGPRDDAGLCPPTEKPWAK